MAGFLAYDGLMWDNALAAYEGQRVRVSGRVRAFIGEDLRRFGSPDHPCPRLGLVPGAGCDAVLFQIPRRERRYKLHNLRQREERSLSGVRVRDAAGRMRRARFFGSGRDEDRWPEHGAVVDALRGARGPVGTGAEYVRTVVHAMELWEIEDAVVAEIWAEVGAWTAGRWRPRGVA